MTKEPVDHDGIKLYCDDILSFADIEYSKRTVQIIRLYEATEGAILHGLTDIDGKVDTLSLEFDVTYEYLKNYKYIGGRNDRDLVLVLV